MKIAYFSKTNIPSPTANSHQSMQVCASMTRLGHSVTFFIISEQDSLQELSNENIFKFYGISERFSITKIKIPHTRESRLRYLWSVIFVVPVVAKILYRENFDLVFGRDILSCYLATVFRKKTIYESHAPVWLGLLEGSLFRFFIRSDYFCKLVVISHSLKKVYLDRYSNLGQKIHVGPDGAEALQETVERVTLQGDPAKINVGYVGHLYEGKGVEVIEAIAPDMPEVDFHIIGGDLESIAMWQKRISLDNVFFYGFITQSELPAYYESLDVCLLPNQDNVFGSGSRTSKDPVNIGSFTSPLKLFEYMAHGKAIVASDLPVLQEILNDQLAMLVSPRDFSGWKEAIKNLFSESQREQLGTAARRELEAKYSWTMRMEHIIGPN